MMNYIWAFMVAGAFIFSFFTGKSMDMAAAVTEGADKAVKLILSIAGSMCLWTGIMNIADKSGLSEKISRFLSPVLCRLIPEYEADSPAMKAVCANVTANILGLGNAATPLGIKAVKEMQRLNPHKDTASRGMIMFIVINTASIQLIPTTTAALRQAAGSSEPYSILPAVWVNSVFALITGIAAAIILGRRKCFGNG